MERKDWVSNISAVLRCSWEYCRLFPSSTDDHCVVVCVLQSPVQVEPILVRSSTCKQLVLCSNCCISGVCWYSQRLTCYQLVLFFTLCVIDLVALYLLKYVPRYLQVLELNAQYVDWVSTHKSSVLVLLVKAR